MSGTIRLATRGSSLALVQARLVAGLLRRREPELEVQFEIVTTKGDRGQRKQDGAFVKEVQHAVLDRRADIAVHSLKDVPTDVIPSLVLAAIPEREDVREVILTRGPLANLNAGRIGTGSLRRQAQLSWLTPQLTSADMVGNVDSRVRQLWSGNFEAIVVAAAGLSRLGYLDSSGELDRSAIAGALEIPISDLDQWEATHFSAEEFLPAAAQAALGLECREEDRETRDRLSALIHLDSQATALAERAVLASLNAGCRTPVAVWGQVSGEVLEVRGLVARPDGTLVVRAEHRGHVNHPVRAGQALADLLRAKGAAEILAALPDND